jgi:hypothetical protein
MTSFTPVIVNDGQSFLGNLDVCHAATPALSSNGEMPCVNEVPCRICQPAQGEVVQIDNHLFQPFLIVLQEERPPKA